MTLWMVWSILFAATVGIAALAIDRALGGFGAPRRHVWMTALVVSAFLPAVLALRRIEITRTTAAQSSGVETVAEDVGLPPSGRGLSDAPVPEASPRFAVTAETIDRVAALLWIAASCILTVVFGRSLRQLYRQRRAWIDTTIGEHPVLLSANDGPAVIGFAHPSIVFPRWALTLDPRAQELMLRHEAEHIRAGDPRTLIVAGLMLVALPWNAALWWLVRRLRMAMELDCDARVIRSLGTSHEYGLMLLAVGERHTSLLPLASSLASARPLLERRIDAMSLPRPRRPLRAALPFLAIALVATTAATRVPRPASLRASLITVPETTPVVPVAPDVRSPVQIPVVSAPVTVTPPQTPATPAPTARQARTSTVAATPSPEVSTPAATSSLRRWSPDRAKIAALATQNLPNVVRGDTPADYILMVFDANDEYLWSTHGLGSLTIEIGGDTRTAEERAAFNREYRTEFLGAAAQVREAARGGDATAAAAGGGARGERQVVQGQVVQGRVVQGQVVQARRGAGDSATAAALGSPVVERRVMQSDTGLVGGRVSVVRGVGGGGLDAATSGSELRSRAAGPGSQPLVEPSSPGNYFIRTAARQVAETTAMTNAADGLEPIGGGKSGIQGLLASSLAAGGNYTFPAGELSPAMLRIVVVQLTPGTTWKGR